ncbi:tetratricopeptide repeat protein [Jeongeupia wiesaeckerbachi]|uniref:tetratricopeptide repeat protein n=1 Tax=Jeongeupia wiesaeckerbachi TaxID=3051218 RepID=UPI003D807F6C
MSLLLQALKRADAQKRQPAAGAAQTEPPLALVADGNALPADEAQAAVTTAREAEPVRDSAIEAPPSSPALARQLFAAKARPPHRRGLGLAIGVAVIAILAAVWLLEPWSLARSAPLTASAPTVDTPIAPPVPEPEATPAPMAILPQPPATALPVTRPEPIVREAPRGPDEAPTRVEIRRGDAGERVPAAIESGFAAFQAGQWREAEAQYRLAVQQDARSRDALLGLAATLAQQGKSAAAIDVYQQLVRLYPDDSGAQAGLAALQRDGGERQRALLKQQADAGDADAAFVLGNRLAADGRWPEAQAAYFQAYTQVPASADYAYNLAVSLDRLQQSAQAADYYRRALTLAGGHPARFDVQAARVRLAALVEPQ